MVRCAAAGIPPHVFYRYTWGEILVVVEADALRRRNSVVDRIVACVRALGQAFNGADALRGLRDPSEESVQISLAESRRLRFWRSTDA